MNNLPRSVGGRDPLDDAPLVEAGVLELVHHDLGELRSVARRDRVIAEGEGGQAFEVVEIERVLGAFGCVIGAPHPTGQRVPADLADGVPFDDAGGQPEGQALCLVFYDLEMMFDRVEVLADGLPAFFTAAFESHSAEFQNQRVNLFQIVRGFR